MCSNTSLLPATFRPFHENTEVPRLHPDLVSSYSRHKAPDPQTAVNLTMFLEDVFFVDERQQTLTFTSYQEAYYLDHR